MFSNSWNLIIILLSLSTFNCYFEPVALKSASMSFLKGENGDYFLESLDNGDFRISLKDSFINFLQMRIISKLGEYTEITYELPEPISNTDSEFKMCSLSDGFIIFYTSLKKLEGMWDIYAEAFDNIGNIIKEPLEIKINFKSPKIKFSLACEKNNYVLLVYDDSNIILREIYGTFGSLNKQPIITDKVFSFNNNNIFKIGLITKSNEYIILIQSTPTVFYFIINDLNEFSSNIYKPKNSEYGKRPSVAYLSSGDIVCVWETRLNSSNSYIVAEIFSSNLTTIKPYFEIFKSNDYDSSYAQVIMLKDDLQSGFLVIWTVLQGETSKILAQKFTNQGSPQGRIFVIFDFINQALIISSSAINKENVLLTSYYNKKASEIVYKVYDLQGKIFKKTKKLKSSKKRLLQSTKFMVTLLGSTNSNIEEADPYAGDDKGGIAITSSYVYLNGDSFCARFNLPDLTNPVSYPRRDGIFSDLSGSGTLYTFWNTALSEVNTISLPFTCNSIRSLNSDLTLGSSLISLSSTLTMSGNSSVFAGYGIVIVHTGSTGSPANAFVRIDLPSGAVTLLNYDSISGQGSESWARWGVAEFDGTDYSVLYVSSSTTISRKNISTGELTSPFTFTNLSDMASFTVSPSLGRWYWHHEGSSQFGSVSEAIGYASGTFTFNPIHCYSSCNTCTAAGNATSNNCSSCRSGYYPKADLTTNCYNSTPTKYYFNSSSNQYRACYPSCSTCSADGSSTAHNCLTCESGYFPKIDATKQCYNTTPEGYWFNSSISKYDNCYLSCKFCTSAGTTTNQNCTSCITGYYKKSDEMTKCLNSAPQYYYLDTTQSLYKPCYLSCFTCSATGSDTEHYCIICKVGYYPRYDFPSRCYNTAPYGLYLNTAASRWDPCDVSCETCINTPKYCTKCNVNYFPLENKPNTCIIKDSTLNYIDIAANQGYYLDNPNTQYFLCDISCISCVNSKANCLKCNNPGSYFPLIDKPNTCVNAPPVGYYFNSTTKFYELCDVSCRICITSPSNCTECNTKQNYFKLDDKPNTCTNYAPDRYYLDFNVGWYKFCHVSCKKCQNANPVCFVCEDNYFPKSDLVSSCHTSIPDETYTWDAALNNWYKCPSPGFICNSDKNFKSCLNGYYLYKSSNAMPQCLSECPDKFWANKTTKECQACISPCENCTAENICKTCVANYFLMKSYATSNCLSPCPVGYFSDKSTGECVKCDVACAACASSASLCQICATDYFLIPDLSKCVSKCPENYYLSVADNKCFRCDPVCRSCTSASSQCTGCNLKMFLDKNLKTCVAECPGRTFSNTVDNTCQACHESCLSCRGPASSDCLSCVEADGVRLNKGFCNSNCEENLIKIKNTNTCFDFFQCFDKLNLVIPKRFSIGSQNFKAYLNYKINSACLIYREDFSFKWYGISDKYITQDQQTVEIPFQTLAEGIITMKVDIKYNASLITSLSGTSVLIIDRVIYYINTYNNKLKINIGFIYDLHLLILYKSLTGFVKFFYFFIYCLGKQLHLLNAF